VRDMRKCSIGRIAVVNENVGEFLVLGVVTLYILTTLSVCLVNMVLSHLETILVK